MPAMVRKLRGVDRIVHEKRGRLVVVRRNGKPVDGGPLRASQKGRAALQAQARAINAGGKT